MSAAFSPNQQRILSMLQEAGGRWMPSSKIAEALHSHRKDGGPEYAAVSVRVTIFNMRSKLEDRGIKVEGKPYHGYRIVETA